VATSVVDVGGAARVEAAVAVAIRLTVGVEAVVAGEGEEAVLVVPAGEDPVDDEAVGLHDVQGVESGALGGEVAEVDAVGAVGADGVQLAVLGVDDDVERARAGALDLQVLLAEYGDEVLVVGAPHLLLVREDLVAPLGPAGGKLGAVAGGGGLAGLLAVEAGQDRDRHPGLVDPVDGLLQMPEPLLLADLEEGEVALLEGGREGGDPALEVRPVRLAHHQVRLLGAQHRHTARAVRKRHRPLLVGQSRTGRQQQDMRQCCDDRNLAKREHGREIRSAPMSCLGC
jgi:hypothetical protein